MSKFPGDELEDEYEGRKTRVTTSCFGPLFFFFLFEEELITSTLPVLLIKRMHNPDLAVFDERGRITPGEGRRVTSK